ncbi:MAG TPA: 4-alpha-glucanotransferase [Thermodesulfobacteriota bacterium]|nr:4-alpha-glucanotransferase [Thermodesulfobacteriota bacterium]
MNQKLTLDKRASGILLHITSLPSSYGVGDLGPEAYRFVDFLAQTKQSYWQVLPLHPTYPVYGNSPYSSISAFAGNTLLISPDLLLEEGLLSQEDLEPIPPFPEGRCDFSEAIRYKDKLLERAYRRFNQNGKGRESFEAFCSESSSWLEDFALFVVLKRRFDGIVWNQWPKELRDRDIESLMAIKKERHNQLEKEKFWQYLFFKQWHSLRDYCHEKGVQLFGDLPIYVSFDSAAVWANPGLFKLDEEKRPAFVSGVPPDYFSETGQLWGNPVYRWDVLKESNYRWWRGRIAHNLELFDVLRIDHFLGLVAYWEIPASEETAINGQWIKAPANDFLNTLNENFPHFPIVAEDLGLVTPEVREVMNHFGLPGMKILQFAFGEDNPMHPFLPHAYEKNFVVYTGTHDNNTVRGWFEGEASSDEKRRLFRYLGREVPVEEIHWALIRLAMMSVARCVILPLQDVLGLGAEARMNRPSVAHGNWEWRLLPGQITPLVSEKLLEVTEVFGRSQR